MLLILLKSRETNPSHNTQKMVTNELSDNKRHLKLSLSAAASIPEKNSSKHVVRHEGLFSTMVYISSLDNVEKTAAGSLMQSD